MDAYVLTNANTSIQQKYAVWATISDSRDVDSALDKLESDHENKITLVFNGQLLLTDHQSRRIRKLFSNSNLWFSIYDAEKIPDNFPKCVICDDLYAQLRSAYNSQYGFDKGIFEKNELDQLEKNISKPSYNAQFMDVFFHVLNQPDSRLSHVFRLVVKQKITIEHYKINQKNPIIFPVSNKSNFQFCEAVGLSDEVSKISYTHYFLNGAQWCFHDAKTVYEKLKYDYDEQYKKELIKKENFFKKVDIQFGELNYDRKLFRVLCHVQGKQGQNSRLGNLFEKTLSQLRDAEQESCNYFNILQEILRVKCRDLERLDDAFIQKYFSGVPIETGLINDFDEDIKCFSLQLELYQNELDKPFQTVEEYLCKINQDNNLGNLSLNALGKTESLKAFQFIQHRIFLIGAATNAKRMKLSRNQAEGYFSRLLEKINIKEFQKEYDSFQNYQKDCELILHRLNNFEKLLSNPRLGDWVKDDFKAGLLFFALSSKDFNNKLQLPVTLHKKISLIIKQFFRQVHKEGGGLDWDVFTRKYYLLREISELYQFLLTAGSVVPAIKSILTEIVNFIQHTAFDKSHWDLGLAEGSVFKDKIFASYRFVSHFGDIHQLDEIIRKNTKDLLEYFQEKSVGYVVNKEVKLKLITLKEILKVINPEISVELLDDDLGKSEVQEIESGAEISSVNDGACALVQSATVKANVNPNKNLGNEQWVVDSNSLSPQDSEQSIQRINLLMSDLHVSVSESFDANKISELEGLLRNMSEVSFNDLSSRGKEILRSAKLRCAVASNASCLFDLFDKIVKVLPPVHVPIVSRKTIRKVKTKKVLRRHSETNQKSNINIQSSTTELLKGRSLDIFNIARYDSKNKYNLEDVDSIILANNNDLFEGNNDSLEDNKNKTHNALISIINQRFFWEVLGLSDIESLIVLSGKVASLSGEKIFFLTEKSVDTYQYVFSILDNVSAMSAEQKAIYSVLKSLFESGIRMSQFNKMSDDVLLDTSSKITSILNNLHKVLKTQFGGLIGLYNQVLDIINNDLKQSRQMVCLKMLERFSDNIFIAGEQSFVKVIKDIMIEYDISDTNYKKLQQCFDHSIISDFLKKCNLPFSEIENLAVNLSAYFDLFNDCYLEIASKLSDKSLLGNERKLLPELKKIIMSNKSGASSHAEVMAFLDDEKERGAVFSADPISSLGWLEYKLCVYFLAVLELEKSKSVSLESGQVYFVQQAKAALQCVLSEMITTLECAQSHQIQGVYYYGNVATGAGGFSPFYLAVKQQQERLKCKRSAINLSDESAVQNVEGGVLTLLSNSFWRAAESFSGSVDSLTASNFSAVNPQSSL